MDPIKGSPKVRTEAKSALCEYQARSVKRMFYNYCLESEERETGKSEWLAWDWREWGGGGDVVGECSYACV